MSERAKINCRLECVIPDGLTMTPIETPRHKWSDIVICPHCGQAFLMRQNPPTEQREET